MFLLPSAYSQNLQKTSIQLMWVDQFEFAGFYMAKEKGFYEKIGLDVEIKKYNLSTNVLNEVLEKKADFGVNSSSLIIKKSLGKDIVILGSIFQSSPLIILALKDSRIKNIHDIKNKKLMMTSEQYEAAPLQSMLISENISLKSIAEAVNANQYYLSHIFKMEMGMSPIRYVTRRRIGEAQNLLINTNLNITEIALNVGYTNSNYFQNVFRKAVGLTPGNYRKKWKL